MNIKDLLERQAQNYPRKTAIIFEDKEITFSQLKDFSFKFANYLINSGVNPCDKIAVFLPNIPQAAFSYLGILSSGAVLVPLDFMLTEEEVINLINHSESIILVAQPKKEVNLENIKKNCPRLKKIIVKAAPFCPSPNSAYSFWDESLEKASPQPPFFAPQREKISSIFYTSGSTGHPKGVMLALRHFNNPVNCAKHFLNISQKDILLCGGVPFSHIGGFDYLLLMLYFGQTLALMQIFQPLEFLKNIEKYKVTLFWIVPSMYVAILALKEYEKFNLYSLRYAIVFGAPSSPFLLRRFRKLCPRAYLLNGWGMTESAAPNCVLPPGSEKIESVGKFMLGMEAKIVDEEGNRLGAGKKGELWVGSEAVMLGYFKEKSLTEKVLTPQGWLKTGDIAYFDEKDFFYIVGRKKDTIKVAGQIVFPSEVEEKIVLCSKIKEAAVVGVKDKLRGEVPKAFVVAKENVNLRGEELKGFLKRHLAHFKIPRYFEFVRELPKTKTGKINKDKLRNLN